MAWQASAALLEECSRLVWKAAWPRVHMRGNTAAMRTQPMAYTERIQMVRGEFIFPDVSRHPSAHSLLHVVHVEGDFKLAQPGAASRAGRKQSTCDGHGLSRPLNQPSKLYMRKV